MLHGTRETCDCLPDGRLEPLEDQRPGRIIGGDNDSTPALVLHDTD
jgi:hypothetical protein